MVDEIDQQRRKVLLDQLRDQQYVYIDPIFFDDYEIVSLALNIGCIQIKDISERLRDDPELARLVIEKSVYQFQYLSERLRDDPELARLVIEKDIYLFKFLSERLKNDRQCILNAAKHNHDFLIDYPQFQDDDEVYQISKENLLQ